MKGNVMRVLLTGMLAILVVQCEKPDCGCPDEQPVYFQYHYINFAWGYQENGWLIDRDGNIRYFEDPVEFRNPGSTGMLTLEDLEYNLGQADSVITSVERETLEEYLSYIPGAADGKIGDRVQIAADAGSATLSCYMYDEEQDAYRYVFLAMSGDWEQFNRSKEAEKLVDWLREFGVFWLSE